MSETIPKPVANARKINSNDARHFDMEGFSGNVLVDTKEGNGYNVLLVNVHGRHYRTEMKGASRNYFVVEGTGTFTLDGEVHTVQKGEMYVIPDGHNYEYEGNMTLLEFNVPGTTADNEINLDEKK